MLKIIPNGDNRLDLELSGKLDSAAMATALDELNEKSSDIEHGRMLYRIGDFDLPTLGALGVELSRLPALFRLIGKFDKVAVVASQNWIRTAGEIEGMLIPGLEIKGFGKDQESEAEAWLGR